MKRNNIIKQFNIVCDSALKHRTEETKFFKILDNYAEGVDISNLEMDGIVDDISMGISKDPIEFLKILDKIDELKHDALLNTGEKEDGK
jgi:hypothetical protein